MLLGAKIDQFIRKHTRKTEYEALIAYLNRLPDEVAVQWKRDGGYITGVIKAPEIGEFETQGKNAKDFIEMVNDAIFVAYDIPIEYFDPIQKVRQYLPPADQLIKLSDKSIKNAHFNAMGNEKALMNA